MKRARIVLDYPIKMEKSWCWRDDWVTGYDSAYGLLSKFGKLNAMGAKELAELFIDRNCGQRVAILRAPKVDLRSGQLFDLKEMAGVLRIDQERLKQAFLLDQLSNSRRKSSTVLRWCPSCARSGFHPSVFQLDLLRVCPTHGQLIRSRCPKCKASIPYRLQADVFSEPFCCSACHTDLAPVLRNCRTRSLKLRESETSWINSMVELCEFEDRMVPIRLDLNRRRRSLGVGEVAFAQPDWRRDESEYIGFIKKVLEDLECECRGTQRKLPFDTVAVTTMRAPATARQPGDERRRRVRRTKAPIEVETSLILKRGWDARLRASYLVYSSVRRYLWRHVVAGHHACICSAGSHLWWHMEGEKTTGFCPVAEAFLRWRMHWEACGTPRYLMAPMRKDPLGIAAWMGADAPICPQGWAWETEQWVSDHVLAHACFGSFREYLDMALRNNEKNKIVWNGHALTGRYDTYWAVTGRNTSESPIRIYEQQRAMAELKSLVNLQPTGKVHLHEHRVRLSLICR